MYSQPNKDKRSKVRYSAPSEIPAKRNSLLTTFEKFQRMRPRKDPPSIMPLEGRSLIDLPTGNERFDGQERRQAHNGTHGDRVSDRGSVDESVRLNLQRISGHPIPSIPKPRNNKHKDIVVESSSYRRIGTSDTNNSAEERIVQMQKQKQKLMRLRHETREAEKLKLMPQSFRLDTLSDEDRINLEKLKDYYCIYYIPGPNSSPAESEVNGHVHLPKLKTKSSCNQSAMDDTESLSTTRSKNGKQVGFRISSDHAIPPSTCNCTCRMYVSGNKVETPFDQVDYSISKTTAANAFVPSTPRRSIASNNTSRESARSTEKTQSQKSCAEKTLSQKSSAEKKKSESVHVAGEKRTIYVDMPVIVYNNSPDPAPVDTTAGLVKAFKQKELRQKELSNLKEDIRELNKMSEVLSSSSV